MPKVVSVLHKEIGCEDCQTQWKHYCPLCKKPAMQIRDDEGNRIKVKEYKVLKDFQRNRFMLKLVYVIRKRKKISKNKKYPSAKPKLKISSNEVQPLPITVDNFHIATQGVFEPIKEIPDTFYSIFKSKGSEYLTNQEKTHIIRISDHWGFSIKSCSWYLKGYPKMHCGTWYRKVLNPKKAGIINVSQFNPNKKSNIKFTETKSA